MSVRSGQSITALFTTRAFLTGTGVNADSLPTGTLYVNGVSNAATVTVANLATGKYTAQVTLPTLSVGDLVEIHITATVSSITDSAPIWRDTKDVLLDASGDVTAVRDATTIGGQLNDGTAVVLMKRLVISNSGTTPAFVAENTNATSGAGAYFHSANVDPAMHLDNTSTTGIGDAQGNGLYIESGTNGASVYIESATGGGVYVVANGIGVNVASSASEGVDINGFTNGISIGGANGGSGYGMQIYGSTKALVLDSDIGLHIIGGDGAGINSIGVKVENIVVDGNSIEITARGSGKDGIISTGGTGGSGFVATPPAIGFGGSVKKNVALAGFEFLMTDSTNHAPSAGATVTATRSIDGAAFGACANSASGVANGVYKIDLNASDLNGNVITFRFTATACDDTFLTIVTQA